jgi:hypothetical protein
MVPPRGHLVMLSFELTGAQVPATSSGSIGTNYLISSMAMACVLCPIGMNIVVSAILHPPSCQALTTAIIRGFRRGHPDSRIE